HLMAQGRNFDPAQFKQDRLDRAHDQLEITNNEEWKAIEPMVGKIIDAEREVMGMRMGGMFGGGRGGRRGGGEANNTNGSADQQRPRRNNFFGEPSAAASALRDAIEAKAPAAELKAKLA